MSRSEYPRESAHTDIGWQRWMRRNGYSRPDGKATQKLTREVEDGEREYRDVVDPWAERLDYILHAYRHTWDARTDQRRFGRRATVRGLGTRPSSRQFQRFMRAINDPSRNQ